MCLYMGQKSDRADLKTIIFSAFENLPDAPVRTIYQHACDSFFADPNIQKLVEALPARTTPLGATNSRTPCARSTPSR